MKGLPKAFRQLWRKLPHFAFTHRMCSCCCSESTIGERPDCAVFDGIRATGAVRSRRVPIGLNRPSARLGHRWHSRRTSSCFSLSSQNSLFSLWTEHIEIPSIVLRRSLTLYKEMIQSFFSLSTKLIMLNMNCFSSSQIARWNRFRWLIRERLKWDWIRIMR
jgi:hypothetical protein